MLFGLLDLSATSAEFVMAVDQNRSKTNLKQIAHSGKEASRTGPRYLFPQNYKLFSYRVLGIADT